MQSFPRCGNGKHPRVFLLRYRLIIPLLSKMSARFVKATVFLRNAQKPTVFSTILSEPWGFWWFELRTTCRRFVNKRRRGDFCVWVLSPQGAGRYSLGVGGYVRETGEYGPNFVQNDHLLLPLKVLKSQTTRSLPGSGKGAHHGKDDEPQEYPVRDGLLPCLCRLLF